MTDTVKFIESSLSFVSACKLPLGLPVHTISLHNDQQKRHTCCPDIFRSMANYPIDFNKVILCNTDHQKVGM